MKKLFAFSLMAILMFTSLSINTKAEPIQIPEPINRTLISEETEVLDNGMIVVTELYDETSPSTITPFSSTYDVVRSKTRSFYNGDEVLLFSFTIRGVFRINPGYSSTCLSTSYSHEIKNSAWSLYSAAASKSGNTITGTAVFKKRLIIVIDTLDVVLTLIVDANGNMH